MCHCYVNLVFFLAIASSTAFNCLRSSSLRELILFFTLDPPEDDDPVPCAVADPPAPAIAVLPPEVILGAVFAMEGSGPRDFRPDDDCFCGDTGARALLDEDDEAMLEPLPVMDKWCCEDGGGGDDLLLSWRIWILAAFSTELGDTKEVHLKKAVYLALSFCLSCFFFN